MIQIALLVYLEEFIVRMEGLKKIKIAKKVSKNAALEQVEKKAGDINHILRGF